MIIQSGKQAGKSTQELVLKESDWVQFFVGLNKVGKVAGELRRHIADFNAKPFVEECHQCGDQATRLSLYYGNALLPYWWCDDCDPYGTGANPGKLTIVRRYAQALNFVDSTCKGRRGDKRALIRRLGEAKGLPKRVGAATANAFLP